MAKCFLLWLLDTHLKGFYRLTGSIAIRSGILSFMHLIIYNVLLPLGSLQNKIKMINRFDWIFELSKV